MLHPWPLAGPFGYVDAGHIPSTFRKRKIPLLDLGMLSREGDIPPASYHVLQTTVWQHLSGENAHYHKQQHAYSDGLQLDPSHSQGLCPCKESKKVSRCCVLYGPRQGIWVRTPFSEMAAHIVIFPPRWPGTSMVALCPMRFLHVFYLLPDWNPPHQGIWMCAAVPWPPAPVHALLHKEGARKTITTFPV